MHPAFLAVHTLTTWRYYVTLWVTSVSMGWGGATLPISTLLAGGPEGRGGRPLGLTGASQNPKGAVIAWEGNMVFFESPPLPPREKKTPPPHPAKGNCGGRRARDRL